ncbi:uncharacterized protein F5147DRAFT_721020 [Suillus discolor]|uniref:Uncharacterized protein n=1 Tax=Suillus discolor TaxID=1912936 RepID=A0A9P7JNR0_9AGAM|nr:uncharacterized protein F5147DRAFT_721020 [Suillus discolor]KAG2093315.1 hypothetical protein F5147DRAFT_721020 [Suillus discolor]
MACLISTACPFQTLISTLLHVLHIDRVLHLQPMTLLQDVLKRLFSIIVRSGWTRLSEVHSHNNLFGSSSTGFITSCILWFRVLQQRLWTQRHNCSTRIWMFWWRMMTPLILTSPTYPPAISKHIASSGCSRHPQILKYFSLLPVLSRRLDGPWILMFQTCCISCLIFI